MIQKRRHEKSLFKVCTNDVVHEDDDENSTINPAAQKIQHLPNHHLGLQIFPIIS